MAVLAADRPFFQFGMTPFTGLVSPLFTKFCNLAGSFFMAFFAVFQHLLMLNRS